MAPLKQTTYGKEGTYVYIAKFSPHGIISTGSDNCIRIFNTETLQQVSYVHHHSDTITELCLANQGQTLVTASKDRSIGIWDLRQPFSKPTNVLHSNGVPLLCVDVNADESALVAGGEMGSEDAIIMIWDVRKFESLAILKESHSDDITSVKFHPITSGHFLSSSIDGLVATYDISTSFDEDDALLHIANTDSAVHTANFFGRNGEGIFVLSTMETMGIWTTEECDLLHDYQDLRERTKADYFIDCVYDFSVHEGLTLFGGDNSGNIALFDVQNDSKNIVHRHQLNGGHNEIVRTIDRHSDSRLILSGGEDGMINLWEI